MSAECFTHGTDLLWAEQDIMGPSYCPSCDLDEAKRLLDEVCKSFEFYAYTHPENRKPVAEWDEYDYMMGPIWLQIATYRGYDEVS